MIALVYTLKREIIASKYCLSITVSMSKSTNSSLDWRKGGTSLTCHVATCSVVDKIMLCSNAEYLCFDSGIIWHCNGCLMEILPSPSPTSHQHTTQVIISSYGGYIVDSGGIFYSFSVQYFGSSNGPILWVIK